MTASRITNTPPQRVTPSGRFARSSQARLLAVLSLVIILATPSLRAQTGGEGGIQGTITDTTGAAVAHATVTATNNSTGVATTRETSGAGLYNMAPIPPGVYSVTATAPGFGTTTQKDLTVNALTVTPLNIELAVGSSTAEVTVTSAPPQLETTNAALSLTIENETYSNLPLVTNNAQRDATAFGSLAPGAQGGARLPIIGGTGNYLGQLYLDGLPAQTVSQQGDNRLVSMAVSVDAIDQMQVLTSTPPVEYSGAGAENFTIKSGGLGYHGQVSDFIRNTSLDAWPFLTKAQTVPNATGQQVPAAKPVDHQNELSATFGGHVPFTKRVFFFVAYDRYHSRTVRGPAAYTLPSTLERQGDFTELNGGVGTGGLTGTGANNPAFLFDPTTTSCVGSVCTRKPFQAVKNGVLTNNIIPANYISPIAKAAQSFLPDPTNPSTLTSNYTGSYPYGFDNYTLDYRVDFQATPNHRISTVGAFGTVGYLNNVSAPYLPQPYAGGNLATIYPKVFDVQDVYTISNSLVNQLKYGYVRFYQNIVNATQNVGPYTIGTLGATNLPQGQAGQEFPGVSFSTGGYTGGAFGNAYTTWTGNSDAISTQVTTPNNFTIVDNLNWTKGAHTLTAGIQVQWQEINNANPATYTGILSLGFNAFATANFAANSNALTTGSSAIGPSGFAYASYLLGAVGGTPSLNLRPVAELGGRYRPIAPYISDTWKVSEKLTIDAGLRWDYLPPYHEVKDRWSFLNPTLTNAATGTPGAIQFAGNYGGAGVSCQCRTPVATYWNNWGPRIGLTYSPDSKTVFRAGVGRAFSQGGGVGGRGGAFNGTGQLGFNTTATGPTEVTSGAAAGPSFYLNNSAYFQSLGIANTDLFGKGFAYPTAPTPGAASQLLNAGNYLSGGRNVNASSVSYADPYFSGRAPNFTFYNFGIQRAITNNLTLAVNYVGNQSHHLINSTATGSNLRGYWSNQLDPKYLVGLGGVTDVTGLKPLLTSPATPANVAKAQAAMSGINIPAFFQADAAVNSNATIAQGLVAFPQYSGVSDTWGVNTGNFSYNSLQVTVDQRVARGLTFDFNYTWSKNIGDDGTFRSGFAIPSGAVSRSSASYGMDRIERNVTTISSPHVFHAFGVYQLPFGRKGIGANNFIVRTLAGGWQLSAIATYASGTPVAVISSLCSTTVTGNSPLQGQCMPDLTRDNNATARINGSYGSGPGGRTACNLGVGTGCKAISYIDSTGFQNQVSVSPIPSLPIYLLGNAPRTRAYGLVNPPQSSFDAAVRRMFPIREHMNVQIEVTASNVLNHTTFGNPNSTFGSSAFGQIGSVTNSPRGFQLAGHFNF